MKKATLVVMSLAAVAGLAGMAGAAPLGVNEIVNNGGLGVSNLAQDGGGGPNVRQTAETIGSNVTSIGQNGGLSPQNLQNSIHSVPISGSTLLLFGAGFIALAVWHYRSRQGMAASVPRTE